MTNELTKTRLIHNNNTNQNAKGTWVSIAIHFTGKRANLVAVTYLITRSRQLNLLFTKEPSPTPTLTSALLFHDQLATVSV